MAPTQLKEYFELLLSAYQPDENGKPLVTLFREDWGLFSHERMDDDHARDLLGEVLNDGEIVGRPFSPIAFEADRLGEWQKLGEELKFHNRFFPEVIVDQERLKSLLSELILDPDEVQTTWYRARIQTGEGPIPAKEMGAPPKRNAAHGRANPAGIPYLYLGSTELTAISEVRPHAGEMICVASFRVPERVSLIDLRNPKRTVSPFLLEAAEDISMMRGDLPFLELLGEELTRPVVPQSAAIDYTPTQYLCEFIKKCGYDGVVYRSSVCHGINVALFDPERAQCGGVSQHLVTRIEVEAAQVGG